MILTLNLLEESLHIYALEWLLIYIYYFRFQITYPYFIFQLIFMSFRGGALGSRETAPQLEHLAFPKTRIWFPESVSGGSELPTALPLPLSGVLFTHRDPNGRQSHKHTYIHINKNEIFLKVIYQ